MKFNSKKILFLAALGLAYGSVINVCADNEQVVAVAEETIQSNEDQLFANAVQTYEKGKYKAALLKFTDFYKNHRQHAKAGDALFFMALSKSKLKDNKEAANLFAEFLAFGT